MDQKLDEAIGKSKYFTWREALFLPRLNEYYTPTTDEVKNIENLALKLDQVRNLIKTPFKINVWIRPVNFKSKNGKIVNYNALVGGSANSAHITGSAVDGYFFGLDIDSTIKRIAPYLEKFKLSMEQNGSAYNRLWLHFQDRPMPDGKYRIFIP